MPKKINTKVSDLCNHLDLYAATYVRLGQPATADLLTQASAWLRALGPLAPAAQGPGQVPRAHACPDWDALVVEPSAPEAHGCSCTPEQRKARQA